LGVCLNPEERKVFLKEFKDESKLVEWFVDLPVEYNKFEDRAKQIRKKLGLPNDARGRRLKIDRIIAEDMVRQIMKCHHEH
jgi:hypothetical protein